MERKTSSHKQRKKRQRMVNISIGCTFLVLILGAAIVGKSMYSKENKAETASGSKAETQKKPLVIDKKQTDTEPDTTNRDDFAVQQGKPAGSSEQTAEKVVYLTMDDGPSQNTQAALDIFDKYNVKATFFVTNAMPEYKDMIKKAYEKGHTIGMHTSSHDYAKVYASQDAYFQDLDEIGQTVKEQIGYVPCFIRFPGGSSNTISANYTSGIMTALSQEVQNRGYQYYDWNMSFGDGGVHTAEELTAQAISSNEVNIVLLAHDSAEKQSTMEALPAVIEHYQSLGYTFKALDRESYAPHHGIGN